MSAHAHLKVGELWITVGREGFDPDVAALFQEADLLPRVEDQPPARLLPSGRYRTTLAKIRDRLQANGYTEGKAKQEIWSAHRDWLAETHSPDALIDLEVPEYQIADLERDLLGDITRNAEATDLMKPRSFDHIPEDLINRISSRALIRWIGDQGLGRIEIELDLSELVDSQILDPQSQPCLGAWRDQQVKASENSPLIVLTEGSSDSSALSQALEVRAPHLQNRVNFLEFGTGSGGGRVEGGVAALEKLLKAFAGAGVSNRVVAVFDNEPFSPAFG